MKCLYQNCTNPVKVKLLPSGRHTTLRFFCKEHFSLISEVFDFISVPSENIIAYQHISEKNTEDNSAMFLDGIKIVGVPGGSPTLAEDAVTFEYLKRSQTSN